MLKFNTILMDCIHIEYYSFEPVAGKNITKFRVYLRVYWFLNYCEM